MRRWQLKLGGLVAIIVVATEVPVSTGCGKQPAAVNTSADGKSEALARVAIVEDERDSGGISHELEELMEMTKSGDWRVRSRAARELGWKREEAAPAVPALISLLGDKTPAQLGGEASPSIRALEALPFVGKPAVPLLIETLKDTDSQRRQYAASILGEIKDGRAVTPLISTLNDSEKWVQSAAIGALSSFADPRAVEPLATFLRDNTKDEYCRSKAVRSLAAFPVSRAFEILVDILKDERQETRLRIEAAIALGATRDHRAAEILLGMANIQEVRLRSAVFWGLGKTGDARVAPRLLEAIKNRDEDERVRQAAAIGLGRTKAQDGIRYLLNAVEDHSDKESVRQSMMAALAFTGDHRAMARLFKELKDGELQYAAALALPNISDSQAVSSLIEELKNESPIVRRFAARALGNLGSPLAVAPLKSLLKDGDSSVVAAARAALERIVGPPWSSLDGSSSAWGTKYEDEKMGDKILGP